MPAAPIIGFSFCLRAGTGSAALQTARRLRYQNEGYQTQCKDEQSIGPDKLVSGHLSGHGQAQHDGDEVCQHILRGFAEGVQYAALPQQVAEHQKTNESYAGRSYHTGNDGYHNGEQNLRQLADIALS